MTIFSNEIVYLVEFADFGFYAKKQPEYDWSFTTKADEANQYKTQKAAIERGVDGVGVYGRPYRIVELSIFTEMNIHGEYNWVSKQDLHDVAARAKAEKKKNDGPNEVISLRTLKIV